MLTDNISPLNDSAVFVAPLCTKYSYTNPASLQYQYCKRIMKENPNTLAIYHLYTIIKLITKLCPSSYMKQSSADDKAFNTKSLNFLVVP